jgi:hypothetical protein
MNHLNLGQTKITQQTFIAQNGALISINKYHFAFKQWPTPHNFDTYNNKPLLCLNNEPLFAELVFLRLLEKQGFTGVWVDTYRKKFWQGLPHNSLPIKPSPKIEAIYNAIYNAKGGKKAGCFDVIAHNNDAYVFAELKRKQKDYIRPTQIEWLNAALNLKIENATFLIAEWEAENVDG